MNRSKHLALSIIVLLIAFGLRMTRLDAQSIWVDEGISLHLAGSSLAEIVADRATNIHPPLYFFVLKGWTGLAGANVFTARFLSVMASLLQVSLIYAVVCRRLGRPAAWIGASLTALSPLAVIYAQEIRVYAMLPLIYLTVLDFAPRFGEKANRQVGEWLLLGLVEVLGLHLHYTVVFLVAYASAYSLLTFWRERRWAELRRWLVTQLAVAIACVPWLMTVLAHWAAAQAEAQAGTQLTQAPPLGYVLAQVWTFHLTGMAGALGRPAMRLLAAIVALLLLTRLILVLLRRRVSRARRTAAVLAAHWLIPLVASLLLWTVRPFSHPRYLILFTPGLTLLTAFAIQDPGWHRLHTTPYAIKSIDRIGTLASVLLASALLLLSLLGLHALFFDSTFAKDDMRTVAHHLEDVAGPTDLILVPDGDWTLPILYRGEAPVEMPGMPDEERTWDNLHRWTLQSRHVFLMNYRGAITRDPRGLVRFALERAGALRSRRNFDDIQLRVYTLERSVEPPTPTPIDARFGPLTLTEGSVESMTPADTALTLALRWRVDQPTTVEREGTGGTVAEATRCHLNVRLLDVDGWPLTARDEVLVDGQSRPTDRWPSGQQTVTYHVLPIPPGTPPLTYTLSLRLYGQTDEEDPRPLDLLDREGAPKGRDLDLATIRLTPPLGISRDPYDAVNTPPRLPQPVDLAKGMRLLGAALDRSAIDPGQRLFVTLHWQATAGRPGNPLPDLRPRLALVKGNEELDGVASAPALGRYPTDRWEAGETVLEHRRLQVPATAPDGPADVVLLLGGQRVALGQVEISAQKHSFTPPAMAHPLDVRFGQVARLIGYDLPYQTVGAGEPIPIKLYWQALEKAASADYTVFSHVLADDGHLVGQHDGRPAQGSRPTTGWIPGEIIVDPHTMVLREAYAGRARIEVGLYGGTMERVRLESGTTVALLPTTLTILEP